MLGCTKRQKVVDRTTGKVVFRCLNRQCNMFRKEVGPEICDQCPLVRKHHKRPCKKLTPSGQPEKTVKVEDIVDVTDEEVMEMIKEAGVEIEGLNDQPLKYEPNSEAPQYPPMSMQLWAYKEALQKWNAAGRPVRSKEEVNHIHETFCMKCDWYDEKKKRCKGCGCRVTIGDLAVLNKIKMATEHCPRELW